MKLGRNDVCHCGSGKKYKKCCLEKDEELERMQRLAQDMETAEDGEEGFNFTEEQYAHLDSFSRAPYEDKFTIFQTTLSNSELVNEDLVFVMLNHLNEETRRQQQRSRFDELIRQVSGQNPELVTENNFLYFGWQIENALYAGQVEAAERLAGDFAATDNVTPGELNDIEQQLSYFGRLSTIVNLVRTAWPKIKNNPKIEQQEKLEFAVGATIYETFDFIERTPEPMQNVETLKQTMSGYLIVEGDKLERNLLHITNQANREWQLRDFAFNLKDRDRSAKETERIENFYYLSFEFLHNLRYRADLSFTKAEIGRAQICSYLLARNSGDLARGKGHHHGEQKRPPQKTRFENVLCPDGESVDYFMHDMAELLGGYSYEIVGFYEMLPAWLDFLQTRGLLEADKAENALAEITGLKDHLLQHVKEDGESPTLIAAIENWPAIRLQN